MSMITTFNSAVSDAVDKLDSDYVAIFGKSPFTPEIIIDSSSDYNCGALCNELEYLRSVSEYYVESFSLDIAEGDNLESLINAFCNLPRRNKGEPDATFRKRFRMLINQSLNSRRGTKWALLDALRYFIVDTDRAVQIIEIFEVSPTYFQLRMEGTVAYEGAVFLNNFESGFLDQNFIGGEGVGEVISYIGELIDRVKTAGIDYDIIFIKQYRFTKPMDARIGSAQMYKSVNANIQQTESFIKTIAATIV